MIGFPTGAPVITDPDTAITLARVVLGCLVAVTVVWYRAWCEVTECCPSELRRRVDALIGRLE